jgi:hypothetical protein
MTEALGQVVRLLLGLGFLHVVGYAGFRLACPQPGAFSRPERFSLSFGLGALGVSLWMLGLSALALPFHPSLLLLPLGLAAGAVFLTMRRPPAGPSPTPAPEPASPDWTGFEKLCLGLLAALFIFAFLRASLFPLWAWDAIATWGFKAKVFHLRQGVDFTGFSAHNYYPNLVPLLLTFLYGCLGRVNDHLVQALFPYWGAMLLILLAAFLRRLGLSRPQALGVTAFFASSGVTFITHLYIAYADLALTYYALAGSGLTYLWLRDQAPPGSLPVAALMGAGLAWTKFEGPPLAATIVLAALLTLLWLRPPRLWRRLAALGWLVGGILLGVLPWRLFMQARQIEVGSDHILSFFPHQLLQALPPFFKMLASPWGFGFLWWAALTAVILTGRRLFATPRLFLALLLAGNLLAVLLGYALPPTSAEEFPFYVRATLDRLLLHIAPLAALLVGEAVMDVGGGGRWAPAPSSVSPPSTPEKTGREGEPLARLPCPICGLGGGAERGQGPQIPALPRHQPIPVYTPRPRISWR